MIHPYISVDREVYKVYIVGMIKNKLKNERVSTVVIKTAKVNQFGNTECPWCYKPQKVRADAEFAKCPDCKKGFRLEFDGKYSFRLNNKKGEMTL